MRETLLPSSVHLHLTTMAAPIKKTMSYGAFRVIASFVRAEHARQSVWATLDSRCRRSSSGACRTAILAGNSGCFPSKRLSSTSNSRTFPRSHVAALHFNGPRYRYDHGITTFDTANVRIHPPPKANNPKRSRVLHIGVLAWTVGGDTGKGHQGA